MIVVDASTWVVALVDRSERGDAAREVLSGDIDWAAPPHAPVEVLRTLRRYETLRTLTPRAATAFADEVVGAAVRYSSPDAVLLAFVWGSRHNLSPYDAPYVFLARLHDVPLVTNDVRLARAAQRLGVAVMVP